MNALPAAAACAVKLGIASKNATTIQVLFLIIDTSPFVIPCSFRLSRNCSAMRSCHPTPRVAAVPCRPHELFRACRALRSAGECLLAAPESPAAGCAPHPEEHAPDHPARSQALCLLVPRRLADT